MAPFLDTLSADYGAGVHVVDFAKAPEASRLYHQRLGGRGDRRQDPGPLPRRQRHAGHAARRRQRGVLRRGVGDALRPGPHHDGALHPRRRRRGAGGDHEPGPPAALRRRRRLPGGGAALWRRGAGDGDPAPAAGRARRPRRLAHERAARDDPRRAREAGGRRSPFPGSPSRRPSLSRPSSPSWAWPTRSPGRRTSRASMGRAASTSIRSFTRRGPP